MGLSRYAIRPKLPPSGTNAKLDLQYVLCMSRMAISCVAWYVLIGKLQKMNSLRLEQEQTEAQCQELKAKVKHLEQENLAKEQEITSLSHKNQLLESEVEKLEAGVKQAKEEAALGTQHGTQNESLQRRLQLLEEEAEESDKQLRETNEKYVHQT